MIITSEQHQQINNITNKYNVKGLILYGSAVDDKIEGHDVDICYIRMGKLCFEDLLQCLDELTDIFNKEKIDLVYWRDASPLLRNEIALNHQILFGDREQIYKYLNIGQRLFWDFRKYYHLYKQKLKRELNEPGSHYQKNKSD